MATPFRSLTRSLAAAVVFGLVLGACSLGPAAVTAPPSAATPITLREAPADLGCDAMGVPYRSATIRIDTSEADHVWAVTDDDARLDMFWAPGFVGGGTAAEPVVLDPQGQVVARDREEIVIPEGNWPRLAGYFVCPGTTAIYVLLQDPA